MKSRIAENYLSAAVLCFAALFVAHGCKRTDKKQIESTREPQSETPDTAGLTIDTSGVYPTLDREKIGRIAIERAGHPRVVLELTAGTWRLTEPVRDKADARAMGYVLDELRMLEWADPELTKNPADWSAYGATDADITTLTITQDGKILPPLHLGKKRVARIGNKPALYRIHNLSYFTFARELRFWRDRVVSRVNPDDVTSLEITDAKGRTAILERIPGPPAAPDQKTRPVESWRVDDNNAWMRPLNQTKINVLFRRLLDLEARDVTRVSSSKAGLDRPRATITIHRADNKVAITIKVGSAPPAVTAAAAYVSVQAGRILLLGKTETALLTSGLEALSAKGNKN